MGNVVNLFIALICFIYVAIMAQIEFKHETIKNYNYVINGVMVICGLINVLCYFIK